jgi:hypothetical protein
MYSQRAPWPRACSTSSGSVRVNGKGHGRHAAVECDLRLAADDAVARPPQRAQRLGAIEHLDRQLLEIPAGGFHFGLERQQERERGQRRLEPEPRRSAEGERQDRRSEGRGGERGVDGNQR